MPIRLEVPLSSLDSAASVPSERRFLTQPGVRAMQESIHPRYIPTVVKCGCGETFVTRSTLPEIKVDICSVCHPFYTGKLKFVDTAGRIEKFQKKFAGGYASLSKKAKKPTVAAAAEE
jgi:large subunit ribosomal protein L31